MLIKTNTEIDRNSWQALLDSSAFSSPFQTPEFYEFFNSIKGFGAEVFAVEDHGALQALAVVTIQKEKGLKAFLSERAIIYGGPLVLGENNKAFEKLLVEISSYYRKKLIYIEIRNYFDYSKFNDSLAKTDFKFLPWLNFQLSIASTDEMLKSMSSSRSRQIKKALKNGVTWSETDKKTDIEAFYNILFDLYSNKIKKPLLPKEFFLNVHKHGFVKYLLVYLNEKVIGGILCPIIEGKAIYEFYVCGLDNEYKDQYPSVMATWAAMEYGSKNGLKVFDFMGAGSPDEDYGVREFKSRFGGTQVEHGRYINILNPLLYKTGKLGLKMLAKIK
jgi:serine/alanine adding enzyme